MYIWMIQHGGLPSIKNDFNFIADNEDKQEIFEGCINATFWDFDTIIKFKYTEELMIATIVTKNDEGEDCIDRVMARRYPIIKEPQEL